MEYDVYVQDKFYKVMSGDYTSDILKQVTNDILENLVPNFDPTQNHNIKINPKN
jgi:hypothetical protein